MAILLTENACGRKSTEKEMFEQVQAVLTSTSRYRSLERSFHASIKSLDDYLPSSYHVDEKNLTFVDTERQGSMPNAISSLNTPRSSLFKSFETDTQRRFIRVVNTLYNAERNLEKEFGKDAIAIVAHAMHDAAKARDVSLVRMASKVTGVYHDLFPMTTYSGVQIILSCNPIDILMKSTAQAWEIESCERYGGSFFSGVFSDIENVSMVAFLRQRENDPFSRIMIRPCIVKVHVIKGDKQLKKMEERWAYGIEKYYYHEGGRILRRSNHLVMNVIPAKVATNAIESILMKADVYNYGKYEACTTPYTYQGYSDVMVEGRTIIAYTKMLKKCESCKDYYSAAIMQDGLCPSCYDEQRNDEPDMNDEEPEPDFDEEPEEF